MELVDTWLPRSTQVVVIEFLALVVVKRLWKDDLIGKRVLLFVDSKAVERALIESHTACDDMYWLTGVFWEQAVELRDFFYVDCVSADAKVTDGRLRNRWREALFARCEIVQISFPNDVKECL